MGAYCSKNHVIGEPINAPKKNSKTCEKSTLEKPQIIQKSQVPQIIQKSQIPQIQKSLIPQIQKSQIPVIPSISRQPHVPQIPKKIQRKQTPKNIKTEILDVESDTLNNCTIYQSYANESVNASASANTTPTHQVEPVPNVSSNHSYCNGKNSFHTHKDGCTDHSYQSHDYGLGSSSHSGSSSSSYSGSSHDHGSRYSSHSGSSYDHGSSPDHGSGYSSCDYGS